ncbi:histidine phosphatase family protein [Psychrobacillus vulpis]|uniref:histidine phosphatase family protein n=1 Tax=Psychrobacillus vulpis TaxID=2325572 RepID=UPI0023F42CBD|nr:histidine phosphatase family protein [Psychrobacillus vulpis]
MKLKLLGQIIWRTQIYIYKWYFNSPDGESYEAVANRISSWLLDIVNIPKVIVVSHGLTGRILRGIYGNFKKEDALMLEVSQNTFFKLTDQKIQRVCSEFEVF